MGARQSVETAAALRMVERGATPHAAALKSGISPATIYRALRKIREKKLLQINVVSK